VPTFNFLWSEHDLQHHHKRRYDKAQLLALAREAELTPVRVSYYNSFLFPLIAGIRVTRNLLGIAGTNDDALPSSPVNGLLRAIFASERHLLTHFTFPFGTSLVLLARRMS